MAKLKRIILHWTGGTYYPNIIDLEHYHFLIDKDGKIYNGKYQPKDNENCQDGTYAAHTGGGNTASIGVGLCGMYNFCNSNDIGNYPLTKIQLEASFKLVAELSKKYNIFITPQNIMTHYEFGKTHPNTSSAGKIDIVYLPPYPNIKPNEIGDFIRQKIKWYATKI